MTLLGRCLLPFLIVLSSACSLRTYAINLVGDALASGDSVYETDDDIDLVVHALPFGLKLTESLLAQSPDHPGLLLTACRGFVLYSYAHVTYEAEVEDLEQVATADAQGDVFGLEPALGRRDERERDLVQQHVAAG